MKKINFSSDNVIGIIIIICFFIIMGFISYNNFQDHKSILPKPLYYTKYKEYIYICPKCKYISKKTYKYCPNCHKRVLYKQTKVELNK